MIPKRRRLQRVPLQQAIGIGFGLALLVLIAVSTTSYRSVMRLLDERQRVIHSFAVLERLQATISGTSQAESAVRSFIITADSSSLQALEEGDSAATSAIASLRRLLAENPEQLAKLDTLEMCVQDRLEMLKRAAATRRDSGFTVAAELVRSGRGSETMREARAIALRLQADENALLLQRAQREEGTLQVVVTAIALGLILACTLAVLAVYAVRRDDEERRRTERDVLRAKEAAEAANRAKSEFLARMSHELRTPLNAVIGFANALRKNKGGNLRTQDITYLERIVANGNELLSLINDVLDLAKIEAGRVDVAAELVSLDVLMYDVLSQFEPEVANRPITLTCEIDKPLAPFIGDSAKLRQVLTNLIGNAIKFTKEGSVTVHVTTDAVSGEPQRIDVIDTGIGIPADRTGAIFHAFEQADRGTAREYGGTGLGLAIARSLCDRMGYTLAVTSEYLRGSTFSVLLTASAQAFARTSGEHITPMHLAG